MTMIRGCCMSTFKSSRSSSASITFDIIDINTIVEISIVTIVFIVEINIVTSIIHFHDHISKKSIENNYVDVLENI